MIVGFSHFFLEIRVADHEKKIFHFWLIPVLTQFNLLQNVNSCVTSVEVAIKPLGDRLGRAHCVQIKFYVFYVEQNIHSRLFLHLLYFILT